MVNPLALATLAKHGYASSGLTSKSWDVFAGPDAPAMDIVITVCDSAAAEACPVWPGAPLQAHWGIADPAGEGGTDAQKEARFEAAFQQLKARFERLLALDDHLPEAALVAALAEIGQMPGSTAR
jgi:arsenate reductase